MAWCIAANECLQFFWYNEITEGDFGDFGLHAIHTAILTLRWSAGMFLNRIKEIIEIVEGFPSSLIISLFFTHYI